MQLLQFSIIHLLNYACPLGICRASKLYSFSMIYDLSGCWLMYSGNGFDNGGFSSTVFPYKCMKFTFSKFYIYIFQNDRLTKGFLKPL